MYRIDLSQAKAEMETLIQTALDGEEVIITQNDEPVLKLARTTEPQPKQNNESANGSIQVAERVGEPHKTFPHVVRTERGLAIAGTRITLYQIMDHLRAEWPRKLIRDTYDLTDEQITDVMGYINAHREEVEAEYELVLKQAAEIRAYWEERNRERLEEIAKLPPKPGQEEIYAKLQELKARLGSDDYLCFPRRGRAILSTFERSRLCTNPMGILS